MQKKENNDLSDSIKIIAKGSSIGLIGAMLGTAIGYLSRMIIARYLGPEEYGLISMGFAIMMVGATFSLMGLNSGIKRFIPYYVGKNDENKIHGTIISSLKICIPLSFLFTTAIIYNAEWISNRLFQEAEMQPILTIFAIAIPFWTLTVIFNSVSIGFQKMQYHIYSMYIFKDSFKLIAIVAFLILGKGMIGAASGWVLAIIGMSILSYYFLETKVHSLLKWKDKNITMYRELLVFSVPLIFVGVTDMVTTWSDTFMLGYFSNAFEVGIYNAALPTSKMLGIPIGPLGNIFGPVIVGLYAKNKLGDMKQIYFTVTKWIFLLVFPGFLFMVIFSNQILTILFGEMYRYGATAMSILAFCIFITALVGPTTSVITAFGRTKIIMNCSIFGAIMNLILNYLLIPEYGINGAAIATGISLATISILNLEFARRIGKISFNISRYKKLFFAASIPLIPSYMVANYVEMDSIFHLIAIMLIFCVFYIVSLLAVKPFENEDILVIDSIINLFGTKGKNVKNIVMKLYQQ